jgi:hypothetical protein
MKLLDQNLSEWLCKALPSKAICCCEAFECTRSDIKFVDKDYNGKFTALVLGFQDPEKWKPKMTDGGIIVFRSKSNPKKGIHILKDFWFMVCGFSMKDRIKQEIQSQDLIFMGLKRSGNHAIINWLMGLLEETYIHHNNCVFHHPNKMSSAFYQIYQGSDTKINFYSLEDYFPRDLAHNTNKKIMILRDPFNNLASRIRHPDKFLREEKALRLWHSYAEEFVGDTNYLQNCVKINYNKWISDKGYRKTIAGNFGGLKNDNIHYVSYHGNGSSFDKKSFMGSAQNMKLLERYKQFQYHPYFRSGHIHQMAQRIFPEIKVRCKIY